MDHRLKKYGSTFLWKIGIKDLEKKKWIMFWKFGSSIWKNGMIYLEKMDRMFGKIGSCFWKTTVFVGYNS
jgi:hypothetical protein